MLQDQLTQQWEENQARLQREASLFRELQNQLETSKVEAFSLVDERDSDI